MQSPHPLRGRAFPPTRPTGRAATVRCGRIVVLVCLGVLATSTGSARAEGQTTALACDISMDVRFENPISLQPSSGRIRTDGPGTVTCTGSWRGTHLEQATAKIRYDGYTRDATCLHAVIGGTITVFGDVIGEPFTVTFETRRVSAAGASAGATDDGASRYAAAVVLTRREGEDCVSKPLTGGHVDGSVVVHGG